MKLVKRRKLTAEKMVRDLDALAPEGRPTLAGWP